MSTINNKTTTIQISHKTKEILDKLKKTEQISTYDAVIRIILLNYKLLKEINSKEENVKNKKDLLTNNHIKKR